VFLKGWNLLICREMGRVGDSTLGQTARVALPRLR
jgi:hypothetical protein